MKTYMKMPNILNKGLISVQSNTMILEVTRTLFHNRQDSTLQQDVAKLSRENQKLVLQLCKNKAFDEEEATRLLCNTPEGIAVQLSRNFGERLKTALCQNTGISGINNTNTRKGQTRRQTHNQQRHRKPINGYILYIYNTLEIRNQCT